MNKIGRNDPCPCGSGKKYKQCCLLKSKPSTGKKKFNAKLISTPKPINLMERTYGNAIEGVQPKVEPETPSADEASEQKE